MIPRGRLFISYSELFKTLYSSFFFKPKFEIEPNPQLYGNSIFCLSARTGLHLALHALKLAPGSAILAANINIPDMFEIIRAHQLEIQSVGVDRHTLGLSVQELKNKITVQTKAILVTHLFGAIVDMDELITFARENRLLVIEDCAQAFNFNYRGHPQSDIVLFSFGLIKTNTTLTGAITCVRDVRLFEEIHRLNCSLPTQKTSQYRYKLIKAIVIQLLTSPICYTLLYHFSKWSGKDFDELLAGFTKGFPGADVMHKIRFRPCATNLKLLYKRTSDLNDTLIQKRKKLAEQLLAKIPIQHLVGNQNHEHTHWIMPIAVPDPAVVVTAMRNKGIDASARVSSLISLDSNPKIENLELEQLVYLPIDKALLHVKLQNLTDGYFLTTS